MSATPFPSRFMGANGYGGKHGVKGRGRSPPGEPERSGGSDRLDAVRLRATLCDRTREEPLWIGPTISDRAGREPPRGRAPALRRRCLRSALGGEHLEPVGGDLDGPSSAAVGGLPLAALEPTLAEVLAGEVGELAPEDHVVGLGVALAIRGDPDSRDVLAGCGLPQLRGCDESPDEGDLVHRVSPALDGSGLLLRAVGLVAAHCCTSCCVDRCHGGKQADCRAEQVTQVRRLALGPCSDKAAGCYRGRLRPVWRSGTIHMTQGGACAATTGTEDESNRHRQPSAILSG